MENSCDVDIEEKRSVSSEETIPIVNKNISEPFSLDSPYSGGKMMTNEEMKAMVLLAYTKGQKDLIASQVFHEEIPVISNRIK